MFLPVDGNFQPEETVRRMNPRTVVLGAERIREQLLHKCDVAHKFCPRADDRSRRHRGCPVPAGCTDNMIGIKRVNPVIYKMSQSAFSEIEVKNTVIVQVQGGPCPEVNGFVGLGIHNFGFGGLRCGERPMQVALTAAAYANSFLSSVVESGTREEFS